MSSTTEAPSKPIRHLAFARPPTTGEFTDFTARYGALLEEDRLSYRETLKHLHPRPSDEDIERVAKLMRIGHLLDLPSVSFSSGQTRRGRIASALLTRPVLLLLEDPMAGLDVPSRKEVSNLLGELNESEGIKIVLVLRGKGGEEMPTWITDVAEVRNGEVWIGKRDEYEQKHGEEQIMNQTRVEEVAEKSDEVPGEPVIKLDGVSVSYGEGTRQVSVDDFMQCTDFANLKIRCSKTSNGPSSPERNGISLGPTVSLFNHGPGLTIFPGSGKTTLLSLILGHHPRSYSLPPSSLLLFSKPRRSIPSPTLRTLIGHTSPEIFSSFPRGMGLSALEAVGSGFEGVFSRRKLTSEQKERVKYLLEYFKDLLKPSSLSGKPAPDVTVQEVANRNFAHFTPPQQGLLLFLRAIVRKPKLLILDEPSQGMDEIIWERCKGLLEKEWEGEGKDMAIIVVSHYEDEVRSL